MTFNVRSNNRGLIVQSPRLNRNDQLTESLNYVFLPNYHGIGTDLTGRATNTVYSGASFDGFELITTDSASSGVYVPASSAKLTFDVTLPFTVAFRVRTISLNTGFRSFVALQDPGTSEYVALGHSSGAIKILSNNRTAGSGSTLSAGTTYDLAFRWDGSQFNCVINGQTDYSVTPSTNTWISSLADIYFGSQRNVDKFANCGISFVGIYNRYLSNAELKAISIKPERLFLPQHRFIYLAASTGSHTSTGALTGQGSSVSGSANNFTIHSSAGALTGQSSLISGSANNYTIHSSSGVLGGQTASITGSANNYTAHSSTGSLVGQSSSIVGSADHSTFATHDSSGALTGQSSTVTGSSLNFTIHETSGSLSGQSSSISGSSEHIVVGTHDTTGSLSGPGSSISGTALNYTVHSTSGVLVGDGSSVIGSSTHNQAHDTSGALVGSGSTVSGTAQVGATLLGSTFGGAGHPVIVTVKQEKRKKLLENLEQQLQEKYEEIVNGKDTKRARKTKKLVKPVINKTTQKIDLENINDKKAFDRIVKAILGDIEPIWDGFDLNYGIIDSDDRDFDSEIDDILQAVYQYEKDIINKTLLTVIEVIKYASL